MSYRFNSGACFSLKMHLVLVTKDRKEVIDAEMLNALEVIFHDISMKWESRIVEFNGEADHVHLLIDYTPKVQITKFVNNLKTVSSRLIRKKFADKLSKIYIKPVFWSNTYFVTSSTGVTIEQLKEYIHSEAKSE